MSVAQRKKVQPQRSIIGRLVEVRKVTVASEVTGKIVDLPVDRGNARDRRPDGARADRRRLVPSGRGTQQGPAGFGGSATGLSTGGTATRRTSERDRRGDGQRTGIEAGHGPGIGGQAAEAKATLEEETERMSRSVILAPFDGTVVEKHAELGGYLSPGDPIVDIVSRGQVDAQLMVPESMINLIQLDQVLPIRIDPLAEEVPGNGRFGDSLRSRGVADVSGARASGRSGRAAQGRDERDGLDRHRTRARGAGRQPRTPSWSAPTARRFGSRCPRRRRTASRSSPCR